MWTPKRILLLAFGLTLFVTGYLCYGRFLGGIDGLPPLPENLRTPTDPAKLPPIDLSKHPNPLLEKIRAAFGEGCDELHRPIKLELNGKSMLVTADIFFIEPDGRLRLEPLSVALVGKDKKDGRGIEINTIRCQKAYLTFDKPLEKPTDVNGRKIVAAELIDKIEIVNNRRTPQRDDDLSVYIQNGPLVYEEKTHLIKTHDVIHLIDQQSKPKPMEIRGKGLEMELAVETPPPPPGAPAGYKPKGETITGVKRIVLQSNVEMHLYVDAHSGFPGGQAAATAPVAPAAPPEKAHVTIKSPGRFQYDLLKDYDLAHFDVAVGNGVVLGKSNSPQDVTVTRHNERLNMIDQLICEHLDLKLIRRENKPTASAKAPAPTDQGIDRGLEIETTHATGKTVTITSDAEKLTAQGGDLFYDAKARLTILKGNPEMFALKEDNTIHAKELHIQEVQPAPGGKTYQQATAIGPGSIDLVDKSTAGPGDKAALKPGEKPAEKKPIRAFWDDTLVSTKDGVYDLLILTRAAKFIDEEHGQTLQGDTLKVWLGNGDKPGATVSQPAQAGAQQARRPHHLEAYGNVSAKSSELNIHETSRLVVWFRDEVAPQVLPGPAAGSLGVQRSNEAGGAPAPFNPASRPGASAVPPSTYEVGKATSPILAASGTTPAPDSKKDEGPPRPIDLSARSVEARVLRGETKNTLETLRCEGRVHVVQDPAKAGEKGVDITGSKLAMDYHPDGNTLVVTSDGQDPGNNDNDVAILQMDKMLIIGNDVHIDQAANKAWVVGPGAMTMESDTSFSGEKLKKTVPLTVHWEGSMLFNGNYAEFRGNNQGEQENARLACENLQVFFDRRVSLKDGNRGGDKPARVQHLMCDGGVRIEDSVYEGTERTKFQQITGPTVAMNTHYPDDDDPRKTEQVSDGNEVRSSGGPGELRILQKGGVDPLAAPVVPPAGSGAAPAKPKPAPAARPDDDQLKMTYVSYGTSMYANSKKNYAKFVGNVRVLNFPCTDPHVEINLDLMLDRMPEGAMYLRSDVLEVWSRQSRDRKYSEMHAAGRALVQSNEFWGRAATIHFDEAKDQIIFDGGDGGKATLFKVIGKGQEPQKIEGNKIIYIRSTGQFWIDKGRSIEGLGSGSPGK